MFRLFNHSLLLRVGLIMAALTLLAITSMMGSAFVGRTIQGEATAVNIAGSLRMYSYRIATNLLSSEELDGDDHWQKMQGLLQAFEGRLYGKELSSILPPQSDHEVRRSFERVNKQWEQEIRPILDAYINGIIPSNKRPRLSPKSWGMISNSTVTSLRKQYLTNVSPFVDQIDLFVKALSFDAEAKVYRFRTYQLGALFLTFAIVLFALFFFNKRIVLPLRSLLTSTSAAGLGDFSRKTSFTGKDELGRLGIAFNDMSETLSKLYADLEERVRIKTKSLERSNRSLDVLYKTVKRLSGTPFPHVTYQDLLEEITVLAGTGPAKICLTGDIHQKAHELASTRACNDVQITCKTEDCGTCLGKGEIHFFDQPKKRGAAHPIISLPIKDARTHHGVLLVEARDNTGFADWQKRVLQAVASHIGMAIAMSGQQAEQGRLALLTERSAIASELHDSLAQSLSYAKIQVSRLDKVLGSAAQTKEAQIINGELREGLNRAYRELRELLTTFRLTMDEDDLVATIRANVLEFAQRGQLDIKFAGDCPQGLLTPNEDIHLLQIVREALSNVLRHSTAISARVTLRHRPSGMIELSIEDNGSGMEHHMLDEKRQHYGLLIMKERALKLGGELRVIPKTNEGGVSISLSFMPTAQQKKGHSSTPRREKDKTARSGHNDSSAARL